MAGLRDENQNPGPRGGKKWFTQSTKTFCLYLQCTFLGLNAINVFCNFLFHRYCRIIL